MIRNSILYRKFWYIKKRNSKKIHVYSIFIVILILIVLITAYTKNNILPNISTISEIRSQTVITEAVLDAVKEEEYPQNINYSDFVTISRDAQGSITSIETNVVKLNRILANVYSKITEKMSSLSQEKFAVPFGAIFGNTIFANVGPNIYVKINPIRNITANYKSEFTSGGVNQTRHRISLQVSVNEDLHGSGEEGKTEVPIEIPIAETIIVGIIPEGMLSNE